MFRNFGPLEIGLIVLVIVLLFGARKLPEAARGLGRSLKIFKAETKGLVNGDEEAEAQAQEAAAPQEPVQQPPAVAAAPQQPNPQQQTAQAAPVQAPTQPVSGAPDAPGRSEA